MAGKSITEEARALLLREFELPVINIGQMYKKPPVLTSGQNEHDLNHKNNFSKATLACRTPSSISIVPLSENTS